MFLEKTSRRKSEIRAVYAFLLLVLLLSVMEIILRLGRTPPRLTSRTNSSIYVLLSNESPVSLYDSSTEITRRFPSMKLYPNTYTELPRDVLDWWKGNAEWITIVEGDVEWTENLNQEYLDHLLAMYTGADVVIMDSNCNPRFTDYATCWNASTVVAFHQRALNSILDVLNEDSEQQEKTLRELKVNHVEKYTALVFGMCGRELECAVVDLFHKI